MAKIIEVSANIQSQMPKEIKPNSLLSMVREPFLSFLWVFATMIGISEKSALGIKYTQYLNRR